MRLNPVERLLAFEHRQAPTRIPSPSSKLHSRAWKTLATPRCDSNLIGNLQLSNCSERETDPRHHDFHSPTGSHESTGFAENNILRLHGMGRTLRSQAFASTEMDVTATSSRLPWLVRHVGWLLSHHAVGRDGLTRHQRFYGRPYKSKDMWTSLRCDRTDNRRLQETRMRSLTVRGVEESGQDARIRQVKTPLDLTAVQRLLEVCSDSLRETSLQLRRFKTSLGSL